MTEIEELKEQIRKLREEVAALRAQPQTVIHYHYPQQPLPLPQPNWQPAPNYPQWPIWSGVALSGDGVRSEGDWVLSGPALSAARAS